MKLRPCQRRHGGYTLLEMILVIATLEIVLLLGMLLLGSGMQIWNSSAAAQNQWSHRQTLTDLFRQDVHQAVEAPERIDQATAGPTCLILRRGAGGHIVYSWTGDRLQRVERPASATQYLTLAQEGATMEFAHSSVERRLITLKFTLPQTGGNRIYQVSAALGGDLR